MRITSLDHLAEFSNLRADVAKHLSAWEKVVSAADWRSLVDLRRTYASADAVRVDSGRTITVFNIGGNRYRLLTAINYPLRIVNVLALLTHAEYDKDKWKQTL
jgi:mRNA interferase HigB